MKLSLVVAIAILLGLGFSLSLALANPALLPKHPGYPAGDAVSPSPLHAVAEMADALADEVLRLDRRGVRSRLRRVAQRFSR